MGNPCRGFKAISPSGPVQALSSISSAILFDQARLPMKTRSPRALDGALNQAPAIFVDDADAHCEVARAAGALVAQEPTTSDYGEDYWADRSYRAVDPEGHHWWFMQRIRTRGKPA